MQYVTSITVTTSHTQASPATVDVSLPSGYLTRVDVVFPPGPAGLVNIQIFKSSTQLFPKGAGTSYTGDDTHISFECAEYLDSSPTTLTIKGWQTGCNFSHTILVYFEVSSLDYIDWRRR